MNPVALTCPARRHFLRRSTLALGALGGLGAALPLTLGSGRARAAGTGGYRALVCIHLDGGNDGLNTVVPTDGGRYAQYAGVRGPLALPQAQLRALAGTDYGLHPALAPLLPLWQGGRLAPVFNVGPLVQPLTKAQFRAMPANSALVPDNLLSHNDQQHLWASADVRADVVSGWGGRASDAVHSRQPVISCAGNTRFGNAGLRQALVLPDPGNKFGVYELGNEAWRQRDAAASARAAALRTLYGQAQANPVAEALAQSQREAFAISALLGDAVAAKPGDLPLFAAVDSAFAPLVQDGRIASPLGRQLYQVAKMVAARDLIGDARQLFYTQMNRFDTHAQQVDRDDVLAGLHADLLGELAQAVAAFDAAMQAIGLADAVTLFTTSDFGRTFAPNQSLGTDHAWGNLQLVFGGGVRGGATYGQHPELALGGPDDIGEQPWERQGRWLPTTGVAQYAATLLRWWGLDEGQLTEVLPALAAFGGARDVGFMT
ncbi:MAG: DUF1501 domain-containing protein [Proteobacteria bacterium]|nr:DUF1501 domain-containing protein [Pseudomonadota bacterium]